MTGIQEAREHALYLDGLLSAVSTEIAQAIDDTAVIREGLKSMDGGGAKVDLNELTFQEKVRLLAQLDGHLLDDLTKFYHDPELLRKEVAAGWDALYWLEWLLKVERLLEDHLPRTNQGTPYWAKRMEECLKVVEEQIEIEQVGAGGEA